MQDFPLVSVICTAYNHEEFIEEALESVLLQSYLNIELIVIDNGSDDETAHKIHNWLHRQKGSATIISIFRKQSLPYCTSFNVAFLQSQGKYLIDLSGDDALLPEHVSQSVQRLSHSGNAGFCFSDVWLEKEGSPSKTFFKRDDTGRLLESVREGDRYCDLVSRHCLMSVSLVIDAQKFRDEGGYDESLSYEDFDIMVRLSRKFPVVFSNHIGVKKKILPDSFSAKQYFPKSTSMLNSTLIVCRKIQAMNQTKAENQALLNRVNFESKHALASSNFEVAKGFLNLARELGEKGPLHQIFRLWAKWRLDFSWFYLRMTKD
ncbi:glycosyltransferase family A protein [Rhodonellum sp.]|uniref:glycosyltransferase family 2 protein n=1 Tax=Rhodonellum sp. TaxID=2231180 RepID=UPI00271A4203|nr:glycosyltransferase family A protein [Rhodonellum sp.]MDO9550949.1 glycosyltransferase family A protein [Rhodonellum sp.]